MLLLMIGNGLQGTLLGVRGSLEGFSTGAMSIVMSAYFAGFLVASRVVPGMIQRVGHVRVFAALGSFISAVLILYPAMTNPMPGPGCARIIGFCFCGVYITAESWLNNAAVQREPRQGPVALPDRPDDRHRFGTGHPRLGRPVGLAALRHPLGSGVDLVRTDPVVGHPDAGILAKPSRCR